MSRSDRPPEASIELAAVAWAERRGWLVRKLKWIGRRNAPDRLFARAGRVVLIEFKRPDEQPRVTQSREHRRLRDAGVEVHVVDDLAQFLRVISRDEPDELPQTKNLSRRTDDGVPGPQLPRVPRRRV